MWPKKVAAELMELRVRIQLAVEDRVAMDLVLLVEHQREILLAKLGVEQ